MTDFIKNLIVPADKAIVSDNVVRAAISGAMRVVDKVRSRDFAGFRSYFAIFMASNMLFSGGLKAISAHDI
jgi:hypothetical protein